MLENILEDLDVYAYCSGLPKIASPLMLFTYPVTWPILVYRLGNWILYKFNIPIIKNIIFIIYFILKRFVELMTGIEIANSAIIGKGLCIKHLGNVIIGHNTKIGEHCVIINNVTIGDCGRINNNITPSIGNYVYIGSGAVLIGNISVGNNVVIGANSVVNKSLSDNVVVAGVPSKILSYEGSSDYIKYRKTIN
jgi:serine O-acetyltransferase